MRSILDTLETKNVFEPEIDVSEINIFQEASKELDKTVAEASFFIPAVVEGDVERSGFMKEEEKINQ